MTKVTYLFGAGASAKALPVVQDLAWDIKNMEDRIKRNGLIFPHHEQSKQRPTIPKSHYQNKLIGDLNWLSSETYKHASIDTFAKKLFLRGKNEAPTLRKLKIALSMYFVLRQSEVPADIRYDSFLASILQKDDKDWFKFPEKIRILSWNYDFQLEKACSSYTGWNSLDENQRFLNVSPKFFPPGKSSDEFSTIKLNGTTAFLKHASESYYEPFDKFFSFDEDLMNRLVEEYPRLMSKESEFYPLLSFAWENWEPRGNNITKKAIFYTQDTEVLVVIGYSFPFFNREVDRKIIGAMENLKKVYFQDKQPEKIRTRFQAIRQDIDPKNLVAYDEVESFLLPDELEL